MFRWQGSATMMFWNCELLAVSMSIHQLIHSELGSSWTCKGKNAGIVDFMTEDLVSISRRQGQGPWIFESQWIHQPGSDNSQQLRHACSRDFAMARCSDRTKAPWNDKITGRPGPPLDLMPPRSQRSPGMTFFWTSKNS